MYRNIVRGQGERMGVTRMPEMQVDTMIVFQCKSCDKIPCMLICESDADVPEFCPWDGTYEADWNMMRVIP